MSKQKREKINVSTKVFGDRTKLQQQKLTLTHSTHTKKITFIKFTFSFSPFKQITQYF